MMQAVINRLSDLLTTLNKIQLFKISYIQALFTIMFRFRLRGCLGKEDEFFLFFFHKRQNFLPLKHDLSHDFTLKN